MRKDLEEDFADKKKTMQKSYMESNRTLVRNTSYSVNKAFQKG